MINNLDKKFIINAINFKKGTWFSSERLDDTIVKITENIMRDGIPFVKVTPKLKRNDDKSIDVTFLIEPSEKKYIDKIIMTEFFFNFIGFFNIVF